MNRYFWILGAFVALVALLAVGLGLNPRDVPFAAGRQAGASLYLPVLAAPGQTLARKTCRARSGCSTSGPRGAFPAVRSTRSWSSFRRKSSVPLIGLNYKEVRGDGGFDMGKMSADEEKKLAFQRAKPVAVPARRSLHR
jgi:cytochrome c biogenesis protein CcmG/thiol:disulfide interchange protein DsbE